MSKRWFWVLIFAFLSLAFLSAKKDDAKILMLQNKAKGLSLMEKTVLYDSNKMGSGFPFALNLLLPIGVGSFVQGDTTGGFVCLVGQLVGSGLVTAGVVAGLKQVGEGTPPLLLTMVPVGAVIMTGIEIFALVRPFTYAKSYNKKLSNAIFGSGSLALVPFMGKEAPGVALVGSVNF